VLTNRRGLVIIDQKNAALDKSYGVVIRSKDGKSDIGVFYPTVCKTTKGLRLYVTRWLIDKDGKVKVVSSGNHLYDEKGGTRFTEAWFEAMNIKDFSKMCRTIRLVPQA
jgi:hypothetical protein